MIYDNPEGNDTFRILVDRLWPRGLNKDEVKVHLWNKEISPSCPLRKWFSRDPRRWHEFKAQYFKELDKIDELIKVILVKAKKESVTLFYWGKRSRI